MNGNTNMINYKRNLLLVAGSSALLAILGTLGVLFWAGWPWNLICCLQSGAVR